MGMAVTIAESLEEDDTDALKTAETIATEVCWMPGSMLPS